MSDLVRIRLDGRIVEFPAGSTVAAALLAHAGGVARRSVAGEPRFALCGMGICYECRVCVDGRAHQRACRIELREGMEVETGD